MAWSNAQGALGLAISLHRPVPPCGPAHAHRGRPQRRFLHLRARRGEDGRALVLALAMGASRRTPSSIVKALPTVPSTLPWSTEGEDDRRVVVVAIVLAHRADLPVSVKTRPWYIPTDRLPELPEELQLLLITEHRLAS